MQCARGFRCYFKQLQTKGYGAPGHAGGLDNILVGLSHDDGDRLVRIKLDAEGGIYSRSRKLVGRTTACRRLAAMPSTKSPSGPPSCGQ